MEDIVSLEGHVYRPGGFSFREGMKVSDLVSSIDKMLPAPDLEYALLVRETQPTREMKILQVNLRSIFLESENNADLSLVAGDRLIIFSAIDDRLETLEPIIATLRAQERQAEPAKLVMVSGTINFPGEYPLTDNMSVKELINAGGGLKEATYISAAEITRKDYSNPERASINHFTIPLIDAIKNNDNSAEKLLAGDHLNLKLIPRFQEELLVTLEGEVKFPGVYEFVRGETLSDIVKRAGGLTDLAHVEATFFSREDLKSKEEKQIAEFRERLKSDITAAQLEDANSNKKTDITTLNTLLDGLENSEATGRLVINLAAIMSQTLEDVQLRDGDLVIIPTYRQEITIIGEVQNPTSHVFNMINDHVDYINKSGGVTDKADESRIYVIKADGSVFLPEKSGWFRDDVTMSPGDTIVVPVETDSLDSLTLWTSVSQIIYQMSLGAAAISRL
jgi:protein involved in polysaccharide export with SLBB domain